MKNKKLTITIFSRGILKICHLKHYFDENVNNVLYSLKYINHSKILGWGFKSTAQRARDYAAKHNLPYIALEDGFLRSVGLGVEGTAPLSLVVDEVGIYYDARQPSQLENLILDSHHYPPETLQRANRCIQAIKQYRLSKYNQVSQASSAEKPTPHVLVIDQTQGDASVVGACADANTFTQMLRVAIESHPHETIWVKVHPDVMAGKKKGFLYPLPFEHPNVRILSERCNPWDLLDAQPVVYTVSSLMGFEALMANCEVHCFGLPFYAGWGLTHDQQICERRNQTRTLEQVFAAAYIDYARYVDPIIEQRCEIESIIHYIVLQLKQHAQPKQLVKLDTLSWWKKRWIEDFLSAWNMESSNRADDPAIGWGVSNTTRQMIIEDGFIRSVGLGVHFNRPISLICDDQGIYFDATRPSNLEQRLNTQTVTDWDRYRAQMLIDALVANNITKYNVGQPVSLAIPQGKKSILVPGQVEGDASIRFGSPTIKTNAELLQCVRQANPDAFIIYKPHPDVLAGQRDKGHWQGEYLALADHIECDCNMATLLNQIDEVHTLTSLTGFEALLRGISVTTYGLPFYAGWGLTQDILCCERRIKQHDLLSFIAITLIDYPTYVDPIKRQPCTPEQAIERMAQFKKGAITVKDHQLMLLLLLKRVKRWIKVHILRQNLSIKD
jgi:capsular polysaccharide export protein